MQSLPIRHWRAVIVSFGAVLCCASPALSQAPDPIVLDSCTATVVVGWTPPGQCPESLSTADNGWSTRNAPLAAPTQYFEHVFDAPAGSYAVWVRLRALNDSKWNDSVWLQFSDALNPYNTPIYQIGTTRGLIVNLATSTDATSLSGWGWQKGAYWLRQTTVVKFATSGSHTIRVQVREDGVSVDQIILSASTYRTVAPGGPTNDPTRFPPSPPPAPPPPPPPPPPPDNNTQLHRLRVVSWNVWQGYNRINGVNDYGLQLDLLASLGPDVVALQEVSQADADMPTLYVNGLTARTGRQWRGYYQRGNPGTDQASNVGSMILTWLPVDAVSQDLLLGVAAQPLQVLHVRVTVNSQPIDLTTTHLYAWDSAVRLDQLRGLQTWVSQQGPRRVIAGDFNAFPGESSLWTSTWTDEYRDAWVTSTSWVQPTDDGGYTFDRRTATQMPERIDYQWTKGMNVSEMFVVKTRRSDHHAIVVDYAVP